MAAESVLVVSREALGGDELFQGACLEGPNKANLLDLFRSRPSEFRFVERGPAESDSSLKQVIPYVVFQRGSGQLFHYRRGKGGAEQRLALKRSIGVGGHINPADAAPDMTFDPMRCLTRGMRREVAEEVLLYPEYGAALLYAYDLLGFLNDDSDEVGSVHLGVVFRFHLRFDTDVRRREHALTDDGCAPLADLRAQRDEFESWSRILLGPECDEAFRPVRRVR